MSPDDRALERGRPERRTDVQSRQRIVDLEQRYRTVASRLTIGIVIIGVTLCVLTAVSINLLRENGERAEEIQDERARATMSNCIAQNERFDAALLAVDQQIPPDAVKQNPEVERSRAFVMALVNALVPRRNCASVVARSVRTSGAEK